MYLFEKMRKAYIVAKYITQSFWRKVMKIWVMWWLTDNISWSPLGLLATGFNKNSSVHMYLLHLPQDSLFLKHPGCIVKWRRKNRDICNCTLLLFPWCHKPRKRVIFWIKATPRVVDTKFFYTWYGMWKDGIIQ